MATRIPRGGSDDAPAADTSGTPAPRTRAAKASAPRARSGAAPRKAPVKRSAPAPELVTFEPVAEAVEAVAPAAPTSTRAAKAIRASRANARAAAAAPARASRTVVIRPDAGLEDDDEGYEPDADEAAADEAVAAHGASNGRLAELPSPAPSLPAAGPLAAGPRPTTPPPSSARPAPVAVPVALAAPETPAEKRERPGFKALTKNVTGVGRTVLDRIGLLAQLAGLVCFLILAIHILFVASDANASNKIVIHFDHGANGLVGDFKNLFSARTGKGRVFENYGTAAVVYLLAGSLVRRILRK